MWIESQLHVDRWAIGVRDNDLAGRINRMYVASGFSRTSEYGSANCLSG